MAAYADFEFYATQYLGTAIAEADFPALALRASAVLDAITFNRAADDEDNTTALSSACCAVAEEIQSIQQNGGQDGIASESVGSHSVSYLTNATQSLTKQQRYEDIAKLYLGNTGLMFAGFADGEYGENEL